MHEDTGKPLKNGIKGLEKLELIKGSDEKTSEGNLSPKVRRSIEKKILTQQAKIETIVREIEGASTPELLVGLIMDGNELEHVVKFLGKQRDIAKDESLGNIDHTQFQKRIEEVERINRELLPKLLKKEHIDAVQLAGELKSVLIPSIAEAIPETESAKTERMADELLGDEKKLQELVKHIFGKGPSQETRKEGVKKASPREKQIESKETRVLGWDEIVRDLEGVEKVEGPDGKDITGPEMAKNIKLLVLRRFQRGGFQRLPPATRKSEILRELEALTSNEKLKANLLSAFTAKGWMPKEAVRPESKELAGEGKKKREPTELSAELPPDILAGLSVILEDVKNIPKIEREYSGEVVKEVSGADIAESIRIFANGTQTESFKQKPKDEQAKNILDFIRHLCKDTKLQTRLRILFRDAGFLEKRERQVKIPLSADEKKRRAFKQADLLGEDVDDIPVGILSAKHLSPENELAPFMKGAKSSLSPRILVSAEEGNGTRPEVSQTSEVADSFEEKLEQILAKVENATFKRKEGDSTESVKSKDVAMSIRRLAQDFQHKEFRSFPKSRRDKEVADAITTLSDQLNEPKLKEDLRDLFALLESTAERKSPPVEQERARAEAEPIERPTTVTPERRKGNEEKLDEALTMHFAKVKTGVEFLQDVVAMPESPELRRILTTQELSRLSGELSVKVLDFILDLDTKKESTHAKNLMKFGEEFIASHAIPAGCQTALRRVVTHAAIVLLGRGLGSEKVEPGAHASPEAKAPSTDELLADLARGKAEKAGKGAETSKEKEEESPWERTKRTFGSLIKTKVAGAPSPTSAPVPPEIIRTPAPETSTGVNRSKLPLKPSEIPDNTKYPLRIPKEVVELPLTVAEEENQATSESEPTTPWNLEKIEALTFKDVFELPQEELSSVLHSVLIVEIVAAVTDTPLYIERVRECLDDTERARFDAEQRMNFMYTEVATREGRKKIVEGAQALLREKISHGGTEAVEQGAERSTELTRERIEALTFENMFDLSAEDLKRVVRNSRTTALGWGICAKGLDFERVKRLQDSVDDQFDFLGRLTSTEHQDTPELIREDREGAVESAKETLLQLLSQG